MEPAQYTCKHLLIGIAIEKGFHSLTEVLLQNGNPPDGRALQRATAYRNIDIVELMLQFGATVDMVDFEYIALWHSWNIGRIKYTAVQKRFLQSKMASRFNLSMEYLTFSHRCHLQDRTKE